MVLTSKRLILYFNPRSHERSDCYSNISLTFSSYFNPRSHERSDATTLRQGIYRLNFNPRSHERSDAVVFWKPTGNCHFNPRSHERSDILQQAYRPFFFLFQSTLPREERLPFSFTLPSGVNISIHAPTRGATGRGRSPHPDIQFQSTLPREERH